MAGGSSYPWKETTEEVDHTKELLDCLAVSVGGKNNHHLDVVPKRGHSGGGDAVADEVKFGRGEWRWRWRFRPPPPAYSFS
jgi:hypothetical protein